MWTAVSSCGVGTWGTFLNGGVNTAEIVIPTINPTNTQNNENIILIKRFVYRYCHPILYHALSEFTGVAFLNAEVGGINA